MSLVKKIIPLLDIDLGSKKLFYSSESVRIRDGDTFKQYEPRLKKDGGISKSFNLQDFKVSVSSVSGISIINDKDRMQDIFLDYPESFNNVSFQYLTTEDTTSSIEKITGIATNPSWDEAIFSMSLKEPQKLKFKNVPDIIFDQNTFQTSLILTDATLYTDTVALGSPSLPVGDTVNYLLVANIVSSSLNNRPENYWKGARIDVIMDQRASDDTNNCSGQFAVVVRSFDSTIFFNTAPDTFMQRSDEIANKIINNTLMMPPGVTEYSPDTLTFQIIKNAVPQNSDNLGVPIPIIYGAVEKIPMVWAIGQKSTNTNSFGVGDDVYLFASHRCKLGVITDRSLLTKINKTDPSTGDDADNGVYKYRTSGISLLNNQAVDALEISDGLRVEVYWSLEDKRVLDAKINPGNKNWIPNPFPKWLNNSGNETDANLLLYKDHSIRRVSPYHRVRTLKTLKGDTVQGIQLRGGEFDWFDLSATNNFEVRGQYPIRYGMGNSKLYVSVEGYEDEYDGFYTGNVPTSKLELNDLLYGFRSEKQENQKYSTLIKNPSDVLLHFIMNYSSVNKDRSLIDVESFRESRQILEDWRIDTAITEEINGAQFVERICSQCCSFVTIEDNKFKMKTVIPSRMYPKFDLIENIHFSRQRFEFTKTEDIYNSFIFYYKYNYAYNKYDSFIRRNKLNSDDCARSFALNGFEREKESFDFRDINDPYTANMLADIYVDIFSKRRTFLTCSVKYDDEVINANLKIGDCVTITSSLAPQGWDQKKCIILATNRNMGSCELRLVEA